jgi:hypothetical protein
MKIEIDRKTGEMIEHCYDYDSLLRSYNTIANIIDRPFANTIHCLIIWCPTVNSIFKHFVG